MCVMLELVILTHNILPIPLRVLSSLMTNDNKDETLIYWTVCVVNIIILKVIFGLGKLASASWFWPRPRPRRFVLSLGLGLGDLSSASASRICPHLTSLLIEQEIYDA